ncbi:conserved Plasmodium protein, unknown function [Plasmodium malariae]|uniref:WD repeat-containing protein n=1 Tax=Plasmodium malariae TaxID=5858 RepID=A0A1C3L2W3_PLAMA|nr:conserved Plasmodium protein, unknown function [Plasmodium malariae]
MNYSIFEGDDFIITESFSSNDDDDDDDENEEKQEKQEKLEKKKRKIIKDKNNLTAKINKDIFKAQDNNNNNKLQKNFPNNDDVNDATSTREDESYEIKNNGHLHKEVNSNNETEDYFNFENYLHSANDIYEIGGEKEGNNKKVRKKVGKGSNKVWYDSDDDVEDGWVDQIENEMKEIQLEGEEVCEEIDEEDEKDEKDEEDEEDRSDNFVEENELEENNLIKNEEKENIFEEYIENVQVEDFEKDENDTSSKLITDDIYVFDDKAVDSHIRYKRRRNKVNEKNIFLKYHLQNFTFSHVDEKKIKQIVTVPKKNLILPVYNYNLYILQYKDKQLNISKKISLNRPIKYAEEYNGNVYMLSRDNFSRNYNLEKGIVYKNRIHDMPRTSKPKEIKFFDNNNSDNNKEDLNTHIFSLSFSGCGKINVYDSRCYETIKTFEMDSKYIGMNFHKRTNSLFAIDNKGYLYNWCLNTNKLVNKLVDNYSIFPSFLNVYNDYLVTCSYNGFLNLFNINNLNEPIKSFKNLTLRIDNAIFNPSHNCLLYYTSLLKNGIKIIDLKTNYIYCNVPWFYSNKKCNVYAANFFNNGNSLCFAVKPTSFYVYDILSSD